MSWDDVGDAIQQAVERSANGLTVIWKDQDHNAPMLDYVAISLTSILTLGRDYVRLTQDLTRPLGEEMGQTVLGLREVPLEIECFTSVATAGREAAALATCEKIKMGLRLDSVKGILRRQAVAAFDPGPSQWIPDIPSTKFRGRAVATVRLYLRPPTVQEFTGYIARVRARVIADGGALTHDFIVDAEIGSNETQTEDDDMGLVQALWGSGKSGVLDVQNGQTVTIEQFSVKEYASIRVRAGGTVIQRGHVRSQSPVTIDSGGVWDASGGDANGAAVGAAGGSQGEGTLPGGVTGQSFGGGSFSIPTIIPSSTSPSGAGGAGNDGNAPTPGTAGSIDNSTEIFAADFASQIFRGLGEFGGGAHAAISGAAGGAGGGDGTNIGTPGAGGGSAGMACIIAPQIVNNGTIRARGGKGGDAPAPPAVTPPGTGIGGGGGGNGGQGGPVFLVGRYSGVGNIDVTGGAAGAGAAGVGTGTAGAAGSAGLKGYALNLDPTTGLYSDLAVL